MFKIDKYGYMYSPNHFFKILSDNYKMATFNRYGIKPHKFDDREFNKELREIFLEGGRADHFYSFATTLPNSPILKAIGSTESDISLAVYHYLRFMRNNEIIYKVRRRKVEYLNDMTLDVPAYLFLVPFKEFLISIPEGSITTSQGSLMNIYVSQEPFDYEMYKDPKYVVSDNIRELINKTPGITRMIRCYGLSQNDDPNDVSTYYQLPIIEEESISKQFTRLMKSSTTKHKDTIVAMFEFVLKLCSYLNTKDPDVEQIVGIRRKPRMNIPSELKKVEEHNDAYGYDRFDVGRIYDTRYESIGGYESDSSGKKIFKRFRVRAHIRAQWYGPRVDGKPGTKQSLIVIEDYIKGPDEGEIFGKTIITG